MIPRLGWKNNNVNRRYLLPSAAYVHSTKITYLQMSILSGTTHQPSPLFSLQTCGNMFHCYANPKQLPEVTSYQQYLTYQAVRYLQFWMQKYRQYT